MFVVVLDQNEEISAWNWSNCSKSLMKSQIAKRKPYFSKISLLQQSETTISILPELICKRKPNTYLSFLFWSLKLEIDLEPFEQNKICSDSTNCVSIITVCDAKSAQNFEISVWNSSNCSKSQMECQILKKTLISARFPSCSSLSWFASTI